MKITTNTFISSVEEQFTTYKHHNHHHHYNTMYYQRFIYNFNFNFMILSQFEKKFDGILFFVHVYISMQFCIENVQLKEVLMSPFVKTMVM
jgi:hypothetical protein